MPHPLPPATVSVDVDPLDLHLVGYGFPHEPLDARVYERALPRLIELFARHRIRATFFIVARDLPQQAQAIQALVAAGHEVASHSLTHPIPFRKLAPEAFAREIGESKRRIEEATGTAVEGFRAPNWDLTEAELPQLSRAGYRYDASSYPSPYLLAARVLLAVKGTGLRSFGQLTKLPVNWKREPHAVNTDSAPIAEFPITTLGLTRFPVYHTLLYGMAGTRIDSLFDRCARGGSLLYVLHAIDLLGLAEDGVDKRLARHPGMSWPLTAKESFADLVMGAIAARFESKPYRERVNDVLR